ncbi:MAG: alpha/beta fold hydrolase [Candidatus Eisenbacteria bacterium]|nr:alpha/beta fold hydrolase [Candidatus Eisenbacteria bacterium]MCC7142658.1 alpha/beta fold hydrolase [Candidatus Eisenbacteria bacterium]
MRPDGRDQHHRGRARDRRQVVCLVRCVCLLLGLTLGLSAAPGQIRPAGAEDNVSFTLGRPRTQKVAADLLPRMARGEFAGIATEFAPALAAALNAETLSTTWQQLVAALGPFQGIGKIESKKTAAGELSEFPVRFARGELDCRVVVDGEGKIAGLHFAPRAAATWTIPSYADTSRFEEAEVVIGTDPWKLPGTLALPRQAAGRAPAVLLLPGSGPNDRDETIGPNKPLRDLSYGLASRGVAVLRYDKRTRVHGARMKASEVSIDQEVVLDALEALAWLRARPEIDPRRIFVVGHSLGAMCAPLVAERDGQVRGIALLAGAARPYLDLIESQLGYLASIEPDSVRAAELQGMRRLAVAHKSPALADSIVFMGAPLRYARDLDARGCPRVAAGLTCPILILQGKRDYQVTLVDFDLWQQSLGEREGVSFRLYPELNHLFMAGEGQSTPEEYERPGHVDPRVIDDLYGFVRGN